MKINRIISLALTCAVFLQICGFSFDSVTVLVDTGANPVYEYCTAEDVLNDFAENADVAKSKYADKYYVVSGKVNTIKENGDSLTIVGTSQSGKSIICSVEKALRDNAKAYSAGDSLAVFGKITVDPFDKEIRLRADKIIKPPTSARSASTYYLSDGSSVNKNSMVKRPMRDGAVTYYIPSTWKGVEHNIIDEKLGSIDGYQYVLNKIAGSEDAVPESFFVCYFDNEQLANKDDADETKLIEKAIINNISGDGKADSFRSKKDYVTYYNAKYDYYLGTYTDELSNGYHVEYIFQKDGTDGLVMYLYVYKNAEHLSDVFFVTRFLEL